jgi:hypothetical protein
MRHMPDYLRAFCERKAGTPDDGPIRFVASTEGVKRDGLNLSVSQWDLSNFRRNPVVLWAHAYGGFGGLPPAPIGRADVKVEGKQLLADVTFDQGDEFARSIERKYRQGFLHAVSVGWDPKAPAGKSLHEARAEEVRLDLLDVSAVPVPGDPDALIQRQQRALAVMAHDILAQLDEDDADPGTRRSPIPPHATERAAEATPYDAHAELAKAEGRDALRRMHAWVNTDADPDARSAYKAPHHDADGQAVWVAVAAEMSRLFVTPAQIPDADRRAVYAHLARHYRQFDREPPEFRATADLAPLEARELRGLFLEGEPDLLPDLFPTERAGAVLSRQNREDLGRIRDLVDGILSRAGGQTTDEDEDEEATLRLLTAALRGHGVTNA